MGGRGGASKRDRDLTASPQPRRGPGREGADRERGTTWLRGWRLAAAGVGVLGVALALAAGLVRVAGDQAPQVAALPPAPLPAPEEVSTPPAGTASLPPPAPALESYVARLGEAERKPPVERAPEAVPPTWRRFAVAAPETGSRLPVAIVIDDLGHNPERMARTIAMAAPLTLAFLPYGRELGAHVAAARRAGHEVLVHVPMEPVDATQDPGPMALVTGLDEAGLRQRLRWQLSRFEGYVGVNNHMGSRFSSDRAGMAVVMAEVKARGLLYVDSRTTPLTLGAELARRFGVPEVERDVFLDNDQTPAGVRHELAVLEETARRQGFAVAIGHPHPVTLEALGRWLATARARGFAVVPVSAIVARRQAAGTPSAERLTLDGGAGEAPPDP